MDNIARAVREWHRVYGLLSVARERLRNEDSTLSGSPAAGPDQVAQEVERLQNQEELALRVLRDALSSGRPPPEMRLQRAAPADDEPA